MSFKELGEYIAMCFEYLENPQKHLANAKKAPVLKETYDVLIERLESKLTGIDNLIYCKNGFETFEIPRIENNNLGEFKTWEDCFREISLDKKNIKTEAHLANKLFEELLLILLKSLFSKINIASIFVSSSEPLYKILQFLFELCESDKEIEQIISRYKFRDFQMPFIPVFQYDGIDAYLNKLFDESRPSHTLINFVSQFQELTREINSLTIPFRFDRNMRNKISDAHRTFTGLQITKFTHRLIHENISFELGGF